MQKIYSFVLRIRILCKTGFYLSIGDADKSPNSIRLRRDLLKDICRANLLIYNQ